MPIRPPRARAIPEAMWALALLFALKAAALALFVTPLWDVPDEVAHFAYVSDLAAGRGIPRAGRTVIPPALVASWMPSSGRAPVWNWTAVHPPAYHALAAPFLEAARLVTSDLDGQVRGTRLASVLFAAAALLVLFRVLEESGGDRTASVVGAASVGFVPMYSHMASGVSNDSLAALAGAAVALCWVRLERSRSFPDALRVGVALAAGGAVKLTVLPVAVALLLLLPSRLAGGTARRAVQTLACAAVALSLPAAWAIRQARGAGVSGIHPHLARGLEVSGIFRYLRDFPVADHTFKNFLGLVGWTGTGHGQVRWIQISGAFLAAYLVGAAGLALATAWWTARTDGVVPLGRAVAAWVPATGAFVLACGLFCGGSGAAAGKGVVYALLAAVPLLAIPRVWTRSSRSEDRTVFAGLFALLVFSLFYLYDVWESFRTAGAMRATHGRYFFVLLGFLLLGLWLPATRLSTPGRFRDRVLYAAFGILVIDETLFFLTRVFPFYGLLPLRI